MTPSSLGFNVLFAQEWNEQYEEDEVVSWAWLGFFTVESGAAVELPDLEISLFDFEQTAPPSGASFSAAQISPASPLIFEWSPYPGASAYWVDLSQGEEGGEGEELDQGHRDVLKLRTSRCP